MTIENSDVKKSYFYDDLIQASAGEANQICRAFGMILAAPQSQAEFDQLKELLLVSENVEWNQAAIAGYRSEEKRKKWISSVDEINFKIDVEANSSGNKENCLGMMLLDSSWFVFDFQF